MDIGSLTGQIVIEDLGSQVILNFNANLDKAGSRMANVGSQFSKAGQALTLGLTVPLAAAGGFAAKAAIDFESSFAGVVKTVDGVVDSGGKLTDFGNELQATFRGMAQTIPISVNEINRIAEAGGQLGVAKEDLAQFTRTMADMGVATNLSSDQAATSLAQIANIIHNEAGPQFDRLGATVVDLGNKSAATESDIVEFGLRLAGAGKVAGMSEPEILGIGSALASVGINAEAGGTAFSKVIINMSAAAQKGGDAVSGFAEVAKQSIGGATLTTSEFASMIKDDAAGALLLFVEGLGNIDKAGGDLFGTLENLGITEQRMRDALLRSAGAGDLLRESIKTGNSAWEANTALTKEAETRYKTMQSQLIILRNKLYDVGIEIGVALMPTLKDLLQAMVPLVENLRDAAEWFAELPQPVRTTALGFLAVGAALGPMAMLIGGVLKGFGSLSPILTGIVTGASNVTWATKLLASQIEIFGVTTGISTTAARIFGGAVTGIGTVLSAMAIPALLGVLVYSLIQVAKAFRDVKAAWDSSKSVWDFLKPEQHNTLASDIAGFTDIKMPSVKAPTITSGIGDVGSLDAANNTMVEVAKTLGDLRAAAAGAGDGMNFLKLETDEARKASEEHEESLKSLTTQFSGGGVLQSARDYEEVLKRLGTTQNLTEKETDEFREAFDAVIEKYRQLGPAGASVVSHFQNLSGTLKTVFGDLKSTRVEGEEMLMWFGNMPQITTAADSELVNFSDSADIAALSLVKVGKAAENVSVEIPNASQTVVTGMQKFKTSVMDSLGDLNNIFMRAFEGGGGVGGAIESFGTKIASKLIGMIPVIGPALSQFGGAIVAGVKKIFSSLTGGPSEAELAGRKIIADFEKGLASGLSAAQSLEAGNDSWKKTVIAVRDAYLATGHSAAEAEAATKRLWDSSRKGADAAKAATQEVQAVIDAAAESQQSATEAHEKLLSDQKDVQDSLNSAVEKYKFTIEELGPALQKQELHKQALELNEDWTLLVGAGMNVATVNEHMADAMATYLTSAITTGQQVPKEMEPMIQSFIDTGALLDENGNKITSMGELGITFAETMSEGFDRIADRLDILIVAMGGELPAAADRAKRGIGSAAQQAERDLDLATYHAQLTASQLADPSGAQSFANNIEGASSAAITALDTVAERGAGVRRVLAAPITIPVTATFNGGMLTNYGWGPSSDAQDQSESPADPNERADILFADARSGETYLEYWLRKNGGDAGRAGAGFAGGGVEAEDSDQAVRNAMGNMTQAELDNLNVMLVPGTGVNGIPAQFQQKERHHTGGIVDEAGYGLMSDEVPIIAQRGEGIISARGMEVFDQLNQGIVDVRRNTAETDEPVRAEIARLASAMDRRERMMPTIIAQAVRDYAQIGMRRR